MFSSVAVEDRGRAGLVSTIAAEVGGARAAITAAGEGGEERMASVSVAGEVG